MGTAPMGPGGRADDEAQRAVDTLAAVLRAFGTEAFDTTSASAQAIGDAAEAWARHVLLGAPRPGASGDAAAGARRDWAGVRQFVLEQRRGERQHVGRTVGDLRGLVSGIVRNLEEALPVEAARDARARAHLQALREAALHGELEALRERTLQTVEEVTGLIEARQAERRAQLDALRARVERLDAALHAAQREGETDPLTGLGNRKRFDVELAKACERSALLREASCLLVVDADHFKRINDTFGHPAGDAVLKALADCLARTFPRKSDGLARYGGEEFAVVLRDATLADAQRLAERLLGNVRALRVPFGGETLRCTVSVGCAELRPGETAARWLERADRALYRAKEQGRDRAVAG